MDVGTQVPDFELADEEGATRRLSEFLADGPVVLFFYPAAMTPGCTREACHFRDVAADYAAAGVQRVGISCDSADTQRRFATRHALGFPLLSDPDGVVAQMFGVRRGRLGARLGVPVRRMTFAIGTDRRIKAVVRSELDMQVHADQALRALQS